MKSYISFKTHLNLVFPVVAAATACVFNVSLANAVTLPAQTTLPIAFTHTVDAAKARNGDVVTAKTMQAIILPGGETLPKNTVIEGHVVGAKAFNFDETPYAKQQASELSIQFDKVVDHGTATPIVVSVRAIANAVEAWNAEKPHGTDESDSVGTMELIGGGHYSPISNKVYSSDDEDIIGYNKKHGVFARLLPADYAGKQGEFSCEGTQSEQAVGIFSPEACGAYGYSSVSISNGPTEGSFRLASTHSTVKLYSGSAALIEVQGTR